MDPQATVSTLSPTSHVEETAPSPLKLAALQDTVLDRALRRMRPVTLDAMQDLALLRRVDVKYLVPRIHLAGLLAAARPTYAALEVDGLRIQRYETLYYDTPELDLYLLHHNRSRRRFKVRSRRYLESDIAFIECKTKERGDRTVKVRRPTTSLLTTLSPAARAFVRDAVGDTGVLLDDLRPTLWNDFSRITLVSPRYGERVTLDLSVLLCRGARSLCLENWVVAEVKGEVTCRDTPVIRHLRALGIRPTGFSKYCIGVASLCPEVKHNRFNRRLRYIQTVEERVREY